MSGSKKPLSKSPTGNLEATSKPKLCTKNCGFFGHPNFGGQCSRCYGEEQKSSRASSSTSTSSTSASEAAATSIAAKSSSADTSSSGVPFGTPRTSGGTPRSVSWDLTPPEKSSNSSSRGTPFPRPPTPYRGSSSRTGTGSDSNKTKRSFSSSKVTTSSSSFTTSSSSQASLKSNGSKRQKMVVKVAGVKEEEKELMPASSKEIRSAKEGEGEGESKKGAKKAKKSRCQQCGTSIEVIGFDCRCGGRFCVVHRHSAGHGCTYDYRAAGQSELRKANPKVVADKVRKI